MKKDIAPSQEMIRFYIITRKKINISNKDILNEIKLAYPNISCSYSLVAKWKSNDNWEIPVRSGAKKKEIENKEIDEVKKLLEENKSYSIRYIQNETGLSYRKVRDIIINKLNFKKLYLRWVPFELSSELRKKRIEISKKNYEIFKKNISLLYNIVTGDESWFFLENKKIKKNKKEWRNPDELPTTIPSLKISDKKYLFTIFFNSSGLVTLNVLDENKKSNSSSYINDSLSSIENYYNKN